MPLFIGGPVQKNTLHFIHRLGHQISDSLEISEGLYWSGDYDQVASMVNLGKIDENNIRFFAGYSGWGEGQLERELSQNYWIVTQMDANFLFETSPQMLWRDTLKKMGGKYKMFSNYPIDPTLN
jgi:putative transcriptional regulator